MQQFSVTMSDCAVELAKEITIMRSVDSRSLYRLKVSAVIFTMFTAIHMSRDADALQHKNTLRPQRKINKIFTKANNSAKEEYWKVVSKSRSEATETMLYGFVTILCFVTVGLIAVLITRFVQEAFYKYTAQSDIIHMQRQSMAAMTLEQQKMKAPVQSQDAEETFPEIMVSSSQTYGREQIHGSPRSQSVCAQGQSITMETNETECLQEVPIRISTEDESIMHSASISMERHKSLINISCPTTHIAEIPCETVQEMNGNELKTFTADIAIFKRSSSSSMHQVKVLPEPRVSLPTTIGKRQRKWKRQFGKRLGTYSIPNPCPIMKPRNVCCNFPQYNPPSQKKFNSPKNIMLDFIYPEIPADIASFHRYVHKTGEKVCNQVPDTLEDLDRILRVQ